MESFVNPTNKSVSNTIRRQESNLDMNNLPLQSQVDGKHPDVSITYEKTIPIICTKAQRGSDFPNLILSTTYLVEEPSEYVDQHLNSTTSAYDSSIKERPKTVKSMSTRWTTPSQSYESSRGHKCSEKQDENFNPKRTSNVFSLSERKMKSKQTAYLPILTKVGLARLKKAKLLDSPYLQGIKEFDTNMGDGIKSTKQADPYGTNTFLENTAYDLDGKVSRTQSAGALVKCMDLVTENWGRVLSAFNGSVNSIDKGYNGSRTCNGPGNGAPYTMSEIERVHAHYKNFLSQTNISEPRMTATDTFKQQMPRSLSPVINRSAVNEKIQNEIKNEVNEQESKEELNTSLETKKTKSYSGIPQNEPFKPNNTRIGIGKMRSKAQQKMERKVRDVCYHCDRSKYWTNEMRNYYEWNAFCLLRKYRNNSQKIKEEMRLLAQDGNYEMDDLWKRAEAFHDFVQDERKESAKSLKVPGIAKTIDVKKFRYNPHIANAQVVSTKECVNVKKTCLKNRKKVASTTTTPLVPPPREPELSFLLPKVYRDAYKKCNPIMFSKLSTKNSMATSNPTLSSHKIPIKNMKMSQVTEADKLKSKIIMELLHYSQDKFKYSKAVSISKSTPARARKNFSTPRWEPVNVLELVTSYIPESKSASYISKRGKIR